MYPYGGQPVDTALDDNDHNHLASHVPGPASQSSGPSDQTSAPSFPYTFTPFLNADFHGHPLQSTNTFPDPHLVDLPPNFRDRYDLVMPGADEGLSTTFVDPFQFSFEQDADYHPVYNPSLSFIPYQGSGPPYIPAFPPPIVSVDGATTLAPGSEDIGPLQVGESLGLDESLSLGDSFHVRDPSPPPRPSGSRNHQPPENSLEIRFWPYPRARAKLRCLADVQGAAPSTLRASRIAPVRYNARTQIHRRIFENAREALVRSALSTCPFLNEQERKTAAHEALNSAASAFDEEYGSQWAAENVAVFYKSFTSTPSADIMSTCKKNARAVVEIGYDLRSPIRSEHPEPQYLINRVNDLVDDPTFPLKFIFGNDSGTNQQVTGDPVYPFEHCVISTVVINTLLQLGYVPRNISELDNSLFCTAAVATECALQELASGKLVYIDFAVPKFKPRYTFLLDYIREYIETNPERSARWEDFKNRVLARFLDITTYCHDHA